MSLRDRTLSFNQPVTGLFKKWVKNKPPECHERSEGLNFNYFFSSRLFRPYPQSKNNGEKCEKSNFL
ncbi:hypothetical protein CEF21_09675 [Bacillus sp. FJAT-42376]|nr:hypothetical protein CEF21_09675 [Bacillus sp. FJAT-42376]